MAHRPFVQEKSSHRPARFAQRVKEELVELVRELRDPRLEGILFITFTSVEVTPDLKNGTVLFTLGLEEINRAKDAEDALNRAAGFLRHELMLRLSTKVTPHLRFKYDKGLDHSTKIDALLKTIHKDDDKK